MEAKKGIRRGVIGRAAERFCKVGVYLSRDEDEDGKFGKRGWWEDQEGKKGGKGRGKVVLDGWLVTYLTCTSLPLVP